MSSTNNLFYVYVYIDPRNFEEFYYGKGTGSRKYSHLNDKNDSDKTKRIKEIKNAGLDPIIKVIAKDLTEAEALLVEKTLIWRLGKTLTNASSGHYAEKFRPHDTLHKDLYGYDFKNGIYYVNVGEGPHRCWEDCVKYGFISAGQGKKWSEPLQTLLVGDIIVAYLKNFGYVGVGRVVSSAVRVNEFKFNNKPLKPLEVNAVNMFENSENDNTEYLVKIEWIKSVDRKYAKWKKNANLFTTQLVKASLQNQHNTLKFIESRFCIKINEFLFKL